MSEEVKFRINRMIDSIQDEDVLQMVMEDVAYYVSNKDVTDELNDIQQRELNEAIREADEKQTINWNDFKKEMDEWRKR